MKKQTSVPIIIALIAGLVFSVGMSYIYADYSAPTTTPVGNNMPAPVHVGIGSQVKGGGLSVDNFVSLGDTHFLQDVFFRGRVNGAQAGSTAPVLKIGGTSKSQTQYTVVANVTGDVLSKDTVGSSTLVNTEMKTLCANDKGEIVFCTGGVNPPPPPVGVAFSSGGPSSAPVQGGTLNTNIICDAALNIPSTNANDEIITYQYTYVNTARPNVTHTGSCQLAIPMGQSSITDYPGQEFLGQDIQIKTYCFDAAQSTVPNNSSVPSC
jgi:hypothetical protein